MTTITRIETNKFQVDLGSVMLFFSTDPDDREMAEKQYEVVERMLAKADAYRAITTVDTIFTATEIIAAVGTNHLNAGESRVFSMVTAYAGNVETEGSTAKVVMTTSDDESPWSETAFHLSSRPSSVFSSRAKRCGVNNLCRLW